MMEFRVWLASGLCQVIHWASLLYTRSEAKSSRFRQKVLKGVRSASRVVDEVQQRGANCLQKLKGFQAEADLLYPEATQCPTVSNVARLFLKEGPTFSVTEPSKCSWRLHLLFDSFVKFLTKVRATVVLGPQTPWFKTWAPGSESNRNRTEKGGENICQSWIPSDFMRCWAVGTQIAYLPTQPCQAEKPQRGNTSRAVIYFISFYFSPVTPKLIRATTVHRLIQQNSIILSGP